MPAPSNRLPRKALALLVAFIASPSLQGATPPYTAGEVRAAIVRNGARAVVMRLQRDGLWVPSVVEPIARGEAEWIALAADLSAGTDAGTSEDLVISLASALPINPTAVLRALDRNSGLLTTDSVCSLPFIEPDAAFLAAYWSRTAAALRSAGTDTTPAVRDACLARLTSSWQAVRKAQASPMP